MQRVVESIELGSQLLNLDCWHSIEYQSSIDVGDELTCSECDLLSFPKGLSCYKKTPIFNQETIPKGFRKTHSTKKGVWALIKVLSGRVRYVIDYLDGRSLELDQHTQGVISPQMEHHLDVIGDVELCVEFYAK